MRTYRDSKITDGSSYSSCAECTVASGVPAKTVAFLFRTRISARLNATASGSYPAFRTRVRIESLSNKKRATIAGDAISYQVVVEQSPWIDKGTLGAWQTPIKLLGCS
jgi:hypothetical protein